MECFCLADWRFVIRCFCCVNCIFHGREVACLRLNSQIPTFNTAARVSKFLLRQRKYSFGEECQDVVGMVFVPPPPKKKKKGGGLFVMSIIPSHFSSVFNRFIHINYPVSLHFDSPFRSGEVKSFL